MGSFAIIQGHSLRRDFSSTKSYKKDMTLLLRFCIAYTATTTLLVGAFQPNAPIRSKSIAFYQSSGRRSECTFLEATPDTGGEYVQYDNTRSEIDNFLLSYYPEYHYLISQNEDIWKEVRKSERSGCTFFAPNAQVFEELGEKKQMQMKDDRNRESVEKIAAYHVVVDEAIGEEVLRMEDWTSPAPADGSPRPLTIGGVLTLGGEVRVGRSKSGGFLGFGAREDGGIIVGNDAKILRSFLVGPHVVHEVDRLISPEILWRYFDQLRIPGT